MCAYDKGDRVRVCVYLCVRVIGSVSIDGIFEEGEQHSRSVPLANGPGGEGRKMTKVGAREGADVCSEIIHHRAVTRSSRQT